ncbi:MAG: class I SAM-dependent methyltransferase [Polyangiaceae bacterium]
MAQPSAAHPADPPGTEGGRVRLGPAEAAVFETFIVPRYLALFGDLALEMMVESEDAQVVHLDCRTGYPDRGIAMRLPGAYVVGVDASAAAIELARAKATTMPGMVSEYHLEPELPTSLPSSAFSHALTLHPPASSADRGPLIAESARLLAGHGQMLVAMPMRGSFPEIVDLLREYALKFDDAQAAKAVEHLAAVRPTVEALGAELEDAGLDFVDVSLHPATLRFQSGRDFFEDPIARLMILPEMRAHLKLAESETAFSYVREAMDKYWSKGAFDLTVNVGCGTGRRVG